MRPLLTASVLFALAASPVLAKAPVVEDSQFLVVLIGLDGETRIIESEIVPLVPDHVCFGWRIRVSGTDKVVKTVEELTLPVAPEAWIGIGDDEYSPTQVSADRRTATTTTFISSTTAGWRTLGALHRAIPPALTRSASPQTARCCASLTSPSASRTRSARAA